MQVSQRKSTRNNKKNLTPEEVLKMAELRLECAKFELGRINDLINRKSFVKRVQKDMDKLSRAMRRQRRAETKVDEYESLILDIKSKLEAKKQEKAQKAAAS